MNHILNSNHQQDTHLSIPVVNIYEPDEGNGSQDQHDDFLFMPVPRMVSKPAEFTGQSLSHTQSPAATAVAQQVLCWLSQVLSEGMITGTNVITGGAEHTYRLDPAQQAVSQVLDEVLAEGEVSAKVRQPDGGEIAIQETRFTGVWRLHKYDGQQQLLADWVAVCPVPSCVWQTGGLLQTTEDITLPETTADMMNGGFVASEIAARLQQYWQLQNNHQSQNASQLLNHSQTIENAHVINLTLLPMNDADLHYLHDFLGEGNSAIFSRGYGKCRIVSSRFAGVWRINYFNDNNTLLQDLIEISRIPEIVLAGAEDFAVSKERIDEVLAWLSTESAEYTEKATNLEIANLQINDLQITHPTVTGLQVNNPQMTTLAADQATSLTDTVSLTDTASNTDTNHASDNLRMECKICWWVYDPATGDEIWQIPPGTPFSLLPDHWRCPHCDADKSGFMLYTGEQGNG